MAGDGDVRIVADRLIEPVALANEMEVVMAPRKMKTAAAGTSAAPRLPIRLVRASATEQSPVGQRQRNSGLLTLLAVPAHTDVTILHPMPHRSWQKQQR